MDSATYYLRTFGGLSLHAGNRAVAGLAAQRKRLALLALLAASGERGLSRDRIQAYLWPNVDTEHARNALYQFIHVLRR